MISDKASSRTGGGDCLCAGIFFLGRPKTLRMGKITGLTHSLWQQIHSQSLTCLVALGLLDVVQALGILAGTGHKCDIEILCRKGRFLVWKNRFHEDSSFVVPFFHQLTTSCHRKHTSQNRRMTSPRDHGEERNHWGAPFFFVLWWWKTADSIGYYRFQGRKLVGLQYRVEKNNDNLMDFF